MQLTKSLFSLLTLISAAAAVVVPTDLADGFYSLKRGGDGKTIATKLGITLNLTASSGGKRSLPDGMAHLERRDLWGSTGRTFPADQQANYDKCTRGWRNWLRWNGGKVPSGEIYTLVIGQAALTGCNYNSGKSHMMPGDVGKEYG